MKVAEIALICSLLACTASGHCGKAFHLTEEEQNSLVNKADEGDAEAAYRMWTYHSMSSRDQAQAAKWLERAAALGHTEAQRWLAHIIAELDRPYQAFGKTPRNAVLRLLSAASKTDGFAAFNLGERYYEGYFGVAGKNTKAREAFSLAASLHSSWSWEHLARMFHRGEGGDIDQVEAYYYICLATQCTHPESITGKELWVLRKQIEEKITLDQATKTWARVDAYIRKERKWSGGRIYPPPLSGTGVPEEEWKEYLKTTDSFESRHRERLNDTTKANGHGHHCAKPE